MSINQLSYIWLHFIVGPIAFVSLAWLISLRVRGAKEQNASFWSLQKIESPKDKMWTVGAVGIVVLLTSVISLALMLLSTR
jgi:hypothetical protein